MTQSPNDQTVEQMLSATVRQTSQHFDEEAERLLQSVETGNIRNPRAFDWTKWGTWGGITVAATLAVFMTLFHLRTKPGNLQDEHPTIAQFESLVAMDETLKSGKGILDEQDLEAIQSISWWIQHS